MIVSSALEEFHEEGVRWLRDEHVPLLDHQSYPFLDLVRSIRVAILFHRHIEHSTAESDLSCSRSRRSLFILFTSRHGGPSGRGSYVRDVVGCQHYSAGGGGRRNEVAVVSLSQLRSSSRQQQEPEARSSGFRYLHRSIADRGGFRWSTTSARAGRGEVQPPFKFL